MPGKAGTRRASFDPTMEWWCSWHRQYGSGEKCCQRAKSLTLRVGGVERRG